MAEEVDPSVPTELLELHLDLEDEGLDASVFDTTEGEDD